MTAVILEVTNNEIQMLSLLMSLCITLIIVSMQIFQTGSLFEYVHPCSAIIEY